MSYVFLRTATFKTGAAAMAGVPVASQIIDLLAEAYKVEAHLIVPAWSGCASQVKWVLRGESLDGFYRNLSSLQSDAKYKQLVQMLGEYLLEGGVNDQIWREVPTLDPNTPLQGAFTMVRALSFKSLSAMAAGLPVLKTVCDYTYNANKVLTRLYVPAHSGGVNRAFMVRRTDELDKFQEIVDRTMNDKKFRDLLGRLTDFVDGSKSEDSLWRTIK